jgi:hypothetical protein
VKESSVAVVESGLLQVVSGARVVPISC